LQAAHASLMRSSHSAVSTLQRHLDDKHQTLSDFCLTAWRQWAEARQSRSRQQRKAEASGQLHRSAIEVQSLRIAMLCFHVNVKLEGQLRRARAAEEQAASSQHQSQQLANSHKQQMQRLLNWQRDRSTQKCYRMIGTRASSLATEMVAAWAGLVRQKHTEQRHLLQLTGVSSRQDARQHMSKCFQAWQRLMAARRQQESHRAHGHKRAAMAILGNSSSLQQRLISAWLLGCTIMKHERQVKQLQHLAAATDTERHALEKELECLQKKTHIQLTRAAERLRAMNARRHQQAFQERVSVCFLLWASSAQHQRLSAKHRVVTHQYDMQVEQAVLRRGREAEQRVAWATRMESHAKKRCRRRLLCAAMAFWHKSVQLSGWRSTVLLHAHTAGGTLVRWRGKSLLGKIVTAWAAWHQSFCLRRQAREQSRQLSSCASRARYAVDKMQMQHAFHGWLHVCLARPQDLALPLFATRMGHPTRKPLAITMRGDLALRHASVPGACYIEELDAAQQHTALPEDKPDDAHWIQEPVVRSSKPSRSVSPPPGSATQDSGRGGGRGSQPCMEASLLDESSYCARPVQLYEPSRKNWATPLRTAIGEDRQDSSADPSARVVGWSLTRSAPSRAAAQ